MRLAALSILSMLLAFGCGNDGESGSSGTNGNGSGATNGGGATNGTGATGGNGVAPMEDAVLCSIIGSPTGATGFIRLVSNAEIQAGGEIDSTEGAIEIGGGVACAVWKNAVFAANFESPTMTRYDVIEGELVEGDSVSFMQFGLSSLGSLADQIQVFSDTKAYFFDPSFRQIIVWNPTTMTTIEAIPLSGFEAPEGLLLSRIRAGRVGDRLLLWANYVNEQEFNVSRSVFAFVDSETDEFTTDVTEACGGFLSASVTTSNGDTYFGSTGGDAINRALGFEGTFAPCAVRVRAGASEVDDTFVADLNQLTGVGPTAGPMAGSGDNGFLLAYDETAMPVDPLRTSFEHTALENWRIYEVELGSSAPARLVEEIPVAQGIGGAATFDGRGFLTRFTRDFSGTDYFDLSRRPIELTYTFSGAVSLFARLDSEPEPRMAQRLPTPVEGRYGASLMPFFRFTNRSTQSRSYP